MNYTMIYAMQITSFYMPNFVEWMIKMRESIKANSEGELRQTIGDKEGSKINQVKQGFPG